MAEWTSEATATATVPSIANWPATDRALTGSMKPGTTDKKNRIDFGLKTFEIRARKEIRRNPEQAVLWTEFLALAANLPKPGREDRQCRPTEPIHTGQDNFE